MSGSEGILNVWIEMTKEVYYAVSKSGQGGVFMDSPEMEEHWGRYTGTQMGCISSLFMMFEADGMKLPNIGFNDGPRKFRITIEEVK